ncbi:MAG: restriction endonuclease subunit S [Chlorobiaceae bacterium]|nr:restriction endonuclease subunit S [Chlorobiaceae bacterium]
MKSTETESTDNRPTIFANRSIPLDQATESSCLRQIQDLQTEIGVYPVDWIVDRIDSAFDIQQGKQVSKRNRDGEHQRPFLRTKNVFWNRLELTDLDQMHFSEAEQSRLELRANDLLVCEGGSIGRTALWNNEVEGCLYQNHLHRLRAKDNKADPQFVVYWLWYAFDVAKLYIGRGNVTTIPNLSQSKLAELPMALPPLSEQKKIAHILSTVQRAIEAQERIIQTATELKKALMHKLFTEGLRNEPQKQTEIGPVPESWEVCKVGDVAKTQSGGTPSRDVPENWNGGTIPWVKTAEINYCVVSDTEEKITPTGLSNSAARIFPAGTLLMAMYGQGITRGRVGLLGIDAATNQACASITPTDEKHLSSMFLYYFFQYHYENLRKLGHGANQRNMNAALIRSFPLSFPKPDEQTAVVVAFESLDQKRGLHEHKKTQLQDLFRTLLHELMTAKIRVHEMEITI